MSTPVLALHGGAGRLTAKALEQRAGYEAALVEALEAGRSRLLAGESALEAVRGAVRSMEDSEHFNAGRGSVLCRDGSIELSASVMDGADLTAGAVACLRTVRYPIDAAALFLSQEHGLVVGEPAERFAREQGLETRDPSWFRTERRVEQWRRARGLALDHSESDEASAGTSDGRPPDPGDDAEHGSPGGTVGAVALDMGGHVAAATSTGGMVNQWAGRVGDTPIVGAGTWADDRSCAVSTTGTGDVFARMVFARRMADLVELAGLSPAAAAEAGLEELHRLGGEGGCVVVDARGRLALPFNSSQMLRGWVRGEGACRVGILPGELEEP